MNQSPPTLPPERNPDTHAAHKRDVFLQITLPTLIGLVVILALTVAVIYAGASGNNNVSRWADISLVWLLLPSTFVSLLFILLLAGLTYGITKVLHILPFYFYKLQLLIRDIQTRIMTGTDIAVEPVLKINSFLARTQTLLRRQQ